MAALLGSGSEGQSYVSLALRTTVDAQMATYGTREAAMGLFISKWAQNQRRSVSGFLAPEGALSLPLGLSMPYRRSVWLIPKQHVPD